MGTTDPSTGVPEAANLWNGVGLITLREIKERLPRERVDTANVRLAEGVLQSGA
jgi:hypothetical protein